MHPATQRLADEVRILSVPRTLWVHALTVGVESVTDTHRLPRLGGQWSPTICDTGVVTVRSVVTTGVPTRSPDGPVGVESLLGR